MWRRSRHGFFRAQKMVRRGVRAAEGARLEIVCRGDSTEGSNPSLSANRRPGEVPEWSIGAVSKTVDRASGPWVRIPPSPPDVRSGN